MKVVIDDKSGFCFGVVKAISRAEESLKNGKTLYSLGDIVHNRVEVQRLELLGLKTINHDAIEQLKGNNLLIRAHGEPPTTYAKAEALGIKIIDATCPVVASLQKIVGSAYDKMNTERGEVVILGKRGHAEVVGLVGQTNGTAIVIESLEELDRVDFNRPIFFLSQTTQSLSLFNRISEEILERAKEPSKIIIKDTICRQVSHREPHLEDFSKFHDVVIFVSGKKSSNGKVLFGICKSANPRCYQIEDETELDTSWFDGAYSVGICGATSTPRWIMEQVSNEIKKLVK